MGSTQGASALSVVNITVPRGVKAAWVRASQARGMKLTDWLVESVRRSMMMQTYPIPEALAPKYHGAGHALAAVTGGQIVDLVYVEDALPDYDQDAPDALRSALDDDRIGPTVRRLQALGEVSAGMCSCWEFVVL